MQSSSRSSSLIGYLKDGAETIIKEAKSASEKVVDAVVNASAQYSEGMMTETQPSVIPVTRRIFSVSIPRSSVQTMEIVAEMSATKYGTSAFFLNLLPVPLPPDTFAISGHVLNCQSWDSTAPGLTSLCHVINVADTWLSCDPDHVMFVMSEGGSGNAALFIASFLVACGLYQSGTAAMQYYARCWFSSAPPSPGILNASQRRYLEHVESLSQRSTALLPRKVILVNLILSTAPLFSVNRSNCKPFLEVFENEKKILSTLQDPTFMRTFAPEDGRITLPVNACVKGDIKVVVYHARNFIGGKMSAVKMFQFSFNTAFLESNCSEMKFPRLKLDGIGRNETKFGPNFIVTLSMSVQDPSEEESYFLDVSSRDSIPPVCCSSEEEYIQIHQTTPDRGRDRHTSISEIEGVSSAPINRKFKDESPDRTLINLTGSSPAAPASMSDPLSRKKSGHVHRAEDEILVDLLSAPTAIAQSSSAPDLATMNRGSSIRIPNSSSDSMIGGGGDDLLEIFTQVPGNTASSSTCNGDGSSFNLLDFSSPGQIGGDLPSFDLVGHVPVVEIDPPATDTLLDPFISDRQIGNESLTLQEPLLIPTPVCRTPHATADSNIASGNNVAQQQSVHGSGSMNKHLFSNGSRSSSPQCSPSIARKAHDPFSDLLNLDTKPGNGQKTASNPPPRPSSPSLGNKTRPSPQPSSGKQPTKPAYTSGPNYFASGTSLGGCGVFESGKPWRPPGKPDTFADLLPGDEFTSSSTSTKQQTLYEQQREEMGRTMDPMKLKILDWTRGKEGNIRALLSSLGEVLWDGETRWTQPGMHLMVTPVGVKKMYRNASRVVHPDKQVGTENEELAKAIQTELNDAYTAFEEQEGV